jgi:hypothetical protein
VAAAENNGNCESARRMRYRGGVITKRSRQKRGAQKRKKRRSGENIAGCAWRLSRMRKRNGAPRVAQRQTSVA